MQLLFTAQNIDLFTVGIAAAAIGLLGFVIYLNNSKSATNISLLLFSLATIAWVFSNFFQYKFTTTEATLLALRINLFIAVWHAFTFFQLALVFPHTTWKVPAWYTRILIPLAAGMSLFTLTPFVFSGISHVAPIGEVTNPDRGYGIILFSIFTFGLLIAGLAVLYRKIKATQNVQRSQVVTVFIALLLTAMLILCFNVLLPIFFNTLTYLPYTGVFMFPLIALLSYSIYRHHLFDIKVVAVEFFVFFLAVITFIEVVVTNDTRLLMLRVLILFLIVIAGILLTRSVIREVEQKEQIQVLADNLKDANEKLRALDKLKSQFLSIASHDLRSPITVIRNFASLVLEGAYGKLPPAAEEGMRQVFERANHMSSMVSTYLSVSRIEQGKMQYEFVVADLSKIIREAIHFLQQSAAEKGLVLTMTISDAAQTLMAKLDVPKINEVIINLVDNAIKYTPQGTITVTVDRVGNIGRVTIQDTGVGMTPKTKQGLFKLFSPGDGSKKINPSSTGIGMYVSKAHVEAHGGTLNGYSEGEGKGSQFVLDLPLLP